MPKKDEKSDTPDNYDSSGARGQVSNEQQQKKVTLNLLCYLFFFIVIFISHTHIQQYLHNQRPLLA